MDDFEPTKIDSQESSLTPEGIEFVLFPAGLLVRSFAWVIDQIIQWTLTVVIVVSLAFLNKVLGWWLFLIVIFCIDWFYHVICELFFNGQSPGKKIMGIRVVRSDGAPVDYSSSFLRNLLRFADTFFFLCPIALVSMISSTAFRRLGDWAGNTIVVYAPKNLIFQKRLSHSWPSGIEPITPAVSLSYEEKQAILSFARRYPLLGKTRANEIAGVYAPCVRNGLDAPDLMSNSVSNSLQHTEPIEIPQNAALPATNSSMEETFPENNASDAALLLGIARKLTIGNNR